MKTRFYNCCLIAFIVLFAFTCANRGNPSGGEKDILPPEIVKSFPENYTINFNSQEIRIYFNEYVKLKDLNKQLIISPPMKTQPEITPLSTASKFIKIKIYDTLAPNTTYSFNFGNSIVDNNEENPFPFYKYVFSTGTYIDSLKVHGKILDGLNRLPETNVLVNLYEADSSYTDSIVYKEKPKYMTNTGDSTSVFTIENIKAGLYKLVALKDENSDNKFQQKADKIGFHKEIITVNTDSTFYDISLFKEDLNFKAKKPRLVSGEKIAFGFEGDYKKMRIKNLSETPEGFTSKIVKQLDKDSLLYFYKPKLKADSLIFTVQNKKKIDSFTVRIKDNKKDSLKVTALNKGKLFFNNDIKLHANVPFLTLNKDKISIRDKDSTVINYAVKLDTLDNIYRFKIEEKEDNIYKMLALPGAFTDFFGRENDTIKERVKTFKYSNFGNIRVQLSNEAYPLFVQFVDDKNEVKYSEYITKKQQIDFKNLKPGTYYLRVLFDENNNGVYDPGNYLKQEQPERVSYANKPVEVRAGWDEIAPFILTKE